MPLRRNPARRPMRASTAIVPPGADTGTSTNDIPSAKILHDEKETVSTSPPHVSFPIPEPTLHVPEHRLLTRPSLTFSVNSHAHSDQASRALASSSSHTGHTGDVSPRSGCATVTYDAKRHTLLVSYYIEIYAPLDRVWAVVLDSVYDTW